MSTQGWHKSSYEDLKELYSSGCIDGMTSIECMTDHPGYEISCRQTRGFGAMISFYVDSTELVEYILKNIEIAYFAESLGGTETLITYPITRTHADVPKDLLKRIFESYDRQ